MTALIAPPASSVAVSANMRANPRTNTKPELLVRSGLHRLGYRFRKDYPLRAEGRLIRPDIVFTRHRLAVFIDGCFWHLCPDHGHIPRTNSDYWRPKLEGNVARDELVNEKLRLADWEVLRLWEHVPPNEAVLEIVNLLESKHFR